jgi:UDP-2-acetamido-3-amino-2,3-dideoxy-glucuronate N-acetyltransferase
MEKDYYAHDTAVIDEPADIGAGTKIWHFSHVMSGASIGSGCTIGQNVFVGGTANIGNNVKIQNNVSVYEGVDIEDDVFCGPSCVFTNVIRPRSAFPRSDREFDRTLIRKGVTIGANATIVCGITIGEHAFIGAGSVVTKDVPAYALYFGNPAKHGGWICRCGEKLEAQSDGEDSACPACAAKYKTAGENLLALEG